MACSESSCWHRWYRFVVDADGEATIDWSKTKLDVKTDDGYEWTDGWDVSSAEVQKAAKSKVRWALKSQKDRGRRMRDCPDGCRCPESEPPADDDPLWTKTPDPQPKRTTFVLDKTTYTIHFVVREFTADVVKPCKDKEEEVFWQLPANELLAVDSEVLATALRLVGEVTSGGLASKAHPGQQKGGAYRRPPNG